MNPERFTAVPPFSVTASATAATHTQRLASCSRQMCFLRLDWFENPTEVDCFALLAARPDSGQLAVCLLLSFNFNLA